jgi:hypothetical protein
MRRVAGGSEAVEVDGFDRVEGEVREDEVDREDEGEREDGARLADILGSDVAFRGKAAARGRAA